MLDSWSDHYLGGSYRKGLKHVPYIKVSLGLEDLTTSCHSIKLPPTSLVGSELIQAAVEESLGSFAVNSCLLVASSNTLTWCLELPSDFGYLEDRNTCVLIFTVFCQ